jgi:hypothetical protein
MMPIPFSSDIMFQKILMFAIYDIESYYYSRGLEW